MFWGIIAYVEVDAYESPLSLTLCLHFMSAVVTLLALGSKVTKFKPEELLNINELFVRIDTHMKFELFINGLYRKTTDMHYWLLLI